MPNLDQHEMLTQVNRLAAINAAQKRVWLPLNSDARPSEMRDVDRGLQNRLFRMHANWNHVFADTDVNCFRIVRECINRG